MKLMKPIYGLLWCESGDSSVQKHGWVFSSEFR